MKALSVPFLRSLLAGAVLVAGSRLPAQDAQATGLHSLSVPTRLDASHPIAPATATFRLDGPWKFHWGDSPRDPSTGAPLWADPAFDDAGWQQVDLAPQLDGPRDLAGRPANPSWTGMGRGNYFGWAWYRIRISLPARLNEPLALAQLQMIEDAYQLFIDGRLLGGSGRFDASGNSPQVFDAGSSGVFAISPVPGHASTAGVQLHTIAFRVWRSPVGFLRGITLGGMRGGPILGAQDAVASQMQMSVFSEYRALSYVPLELVLLLVLAIIVFGQTLFDRSDPVFIWVAAMLVVMSLYDVTMLLQNARVLSVVQQLLIDDILLDPLMLGGWATVWWLWFRFRRPSWIPWTIGGMTILHAASRLLEDAYMFRNTAVYAWEPVFQDIAVVVRLLCLALLLYIVVLGIRKHGSEGWIVLPSALLIAPQQFTGELGPLGFPIVWFPFGVVIYIGYVANLFLMVTVMLLLLRRVLLAVRRQRQMALDVKQAHEVQQVLIPEAIPEIANFRIESVYLPAGEVGGDFFQIIRTAQGAALLCIGDVSGKGLPAAMTVSLLVGTFRTLARYTQSPGAILDAMNIRMLGRSRGGFTTCLVARAEPDGTLTIANAGHIPPYVQGKEVQLESGLPIGLSASSQYPEAQIALGVREQLTMMTDGVVEARRSSGELLGFDRTAAMTTHSAQIIAVTAKEFGQEDDITVLTVTRTDDDAIDTATCPVAEGLPETA